MSQIIILKFAVFWALSDTHFCMQHRGERRGLGGIFFDDLNDYDQEMLLSFATGNCLRIFGAFLVTIPVNISHYSNDTILFLHIKL